MIRNERKVIIRQGFPFKYSVDGGLSWVDVPANTDVEIDPELLTSNDTLMLVSDSPDATLINPDGLRLTTAPFSAFNLKNGVLIESLNDLFKDTKIEDVRLAHLDVCETATNVFDGAEICNVSSIYLPKASDVSSIVSNANIKKIGVLDFPIATKATELAKDSQINVMADVTIGNQLPDDCSLTNADSAFENAVIDIFPNVSLSEMFMSRSDAIGSASLDAFFKGLDTKYMLNQLFETNGELQDLGSTVSQYFSSNMFDGSTAKFAGMDLLARKGSVGGLANMDTDAKFVSRIMNDVTSASISVPTSYESVQPGSVAELESSTSTGEYKNVNWMPDIIELETFTQPLCANSDITAIGALDDKHIQFVYNDGSRETALFIDPLKSLELGNKEPASPDFENIVSIGRNGTYLKTIGNTIQVVKDDGVTVISENTDYVGVNSVQFVGNGDHYTVAYGADTIAIVDSATGIETNSVTKTLNTGETIVSAYLSNIEFGNLMLLINDGSNNIAKAYDGFDGLQVGSDIPLGTKEFLAHNYIERAEILVVDFANGDTSRLFIGHKEI